MTAATTAATTVGIRPSLARSAWASLGTGAKVWGIGMATVFVICFVLLQRPWSWTDFGQASFSLQQMAFWFGMSCMSLAGLAVTPDEVRAHREARKQRWLSSPHAIRLGLASTGAATRARSLPAPVIFAAPIHQVLAQPLWVALGAASLSFGLVMVGAGYSIRKIVIISPRFEFVFWPVVFGSILLFGLIRATWRTHEMYLWSEEQAARIARAQAETERARLTELQARLNPPLILDTLRSVATLARTDARRAEAMVEDLSMELRRGLGRSSTSISPEEATSLLPAKRRSLVSAVWNASMPESLPFVVLGLALIALVLFSIAGKGLGPGLPAIAAGLEPLFFLCGLLLLMAQGLLVPRPRQWLERVQQLFSLWVPNSSRTQGVDESPGNGVVALPVFVGLGSACIGCSLGLCLTRVFVASPWVESPPFPILHPVAGGLFLLLAASHASRATYGLYAWGQAKAVLASQAQADADRARMAALQAQTNPHFLFNALNTVASLLATDAARAERTIESLTHVLERTLQRSSDPLTTLDEELRFVREYLDIERERFGDRLIVTFDVDPVALSIRVPTMSVQALVENAIKYAIAERLEGGHVLIEARVIDNTLRLSVTDDGPGFVEPHVGGGGLSNLRQRLQSLYGDAGRLIVHTPDSGARVTIAIPATHTLTVHRP